MSLSRSANQITASVCVLCFFGWSEDLFYAYREWVEEAEDRFLVFVVPSDSGVFTAFSIDHPKVRFYTLYDSYETCKRIAWEFVFLSLELLAAPGMEGSCSYLEFSKTFKECSRGVHLVASEYRDLGASIMKNVRGNLLAVDHVVDFSYLRDSFKNIPAIICGAGPSLGNHYSHLKTLFHKALLFSGGASITALSLESVDAHFAAGIDPDPSYKRFFEHAFFETPFFYQDRLSKDILSLVHGLLLRAPDGGTHSLERYFSASLGLSEGIFESGWTVATFCTALATYLGCNPIIFLGMDFDSGLQKYVGNLREDRRDDDVKNDWKMSVCWLEEFAKRHTDTSFFNASLMESPLFPYQPLEQIEKKYLQQTYDLSGRIHAVLQMTPKKKLDNKAEVFSAVDGSLERCYSLVSRMIALLERHYPDDATVKGEFVLCQYDLYDELVYQKLLEPLWSIWKYVFERRSRLSAFNGLLSQLLFYKKILQSHKRWP